MNTLNKSWIQQLFLKKQKLQKKEQIIEQRWGSIV